MDIFDRILLLKNSPVFEQVSTEDLRFVAKSMETVTYLVGERIFSKGENGDDMYIIESGKVGIILDESDSKSGYVAELEAGDCFGEMNILDSLPRSASAIVIEDSFILTLDGTRLRGLIIRHPEIALGMLKGISLRLRESNEK